MEQRPRHPENDPDRNIPEHERLQAGEIDLTGAVQQDDDLSDVIHDAITEAEGDDGRLPEWGARTIARALANQHHTPRGALHHFAVTGRAFPDAMAQELAQLLETNDDTREWSDWLSAYLDNVPDTAAPHTEAASPGSDTPEHDLIDREPRHQARHYVRHEYPFDGTALDKVRHQLRNVFAEADARGEPVDAANAQAIATLLASLLPPGSQMHHFAETGDAHAALLHDECQAIKQRRWRTPDIPDWLERLEQHLATQTHLGRQNREAPTDTQDSQPEQPDRSHEHGDAFRAFLQLSATEQPHEDPVESFREFYLGSFGTMDDLLDNLTDLRRGTAAISQAAEAWGLEEFVTIDTTALGEAARNAWSVVEYGDKLHVFMK